MSTTVRITALGEGRYESHLAGATATVEDALRGEGVEVKGRRVSVNGRSAVPSTPLVAGDEITVVDYLQGG